MPLLVRAVTAARQVLPRRPAEILQGPLRLAAPVAASLAAAQPEAGLAGGTAMPGGGADDGGVGAAAGVGVGVAAGCGGTGAAGVGGAAAG